MKLKKNKNLRRTSAGVRVGIMQIVVLVVPTDWPDALPRFLVPNLAGQLVLNSESFNGQSAVVHWTDKVERDGRGCIERCG